MFRATAVHVGIALRVVRNNGRMTSPESPEIVPAGSTAVADRTSEQAQSQRPWVTLVWDDPVNLMSYVTHVFTTYFKYSREKAEQLMLQVHNEGKCVVSSGGREQMEGDVAAMQGYGLWATMEQSE